MGMELGRQRIVYLAIGLLLVFFVALNFWFLNPTGSGTTTSAGGAGGGGTTTRSGIAASSDRIAVLVTSAGTTADALADSKRWPASVFTVIRLPPSTIAASAVATNPSAEWADVLTRWMRHPSFSRHDVVLVAPPASPAAAAANGNGATTGGVCAQTAFYWSGVLRWMREYKPFISALRVSDHWIGDGDSDSDSRSGAVWPFGGLLLYTSDVPTLIALTRVPVTTQTTSFSAVMDRRIDANGDRQLYRFKFPLQITAPALTLADDTFFCAATQTPTASDDASAAPESDECGTVSLVSPCERIELRIPPPPALPAPAPPPIDNSAGAVKCAPATAPAPAAKPKPKPIDTPSHEHHHHSRSSAVGHIDASLDWKALAVLVPHLCEMTASGAEPKTYTESAGGKRQFHPEWWPAKFFETHVYRVAKNLNTIHPPGEHTPPVPRSAAAPGAVPAGSDSRATQWRQALDYADILRHWSAAKCHGHEIFMFAEDDIEPCPGMIEYLGLIMQWMRLHTGQWGLVRLGVGFSGLLFRCTDIPSFVDEIDRQRRERGLGGQLPIDWLVDQWNNAGRPPYVFRFNLLRHAGVDSGSIWTHAETAERDAETSQCMEILNWRSEQPGHFNMRQCAHAMFSPCSNESWERKPPPPLPLPPPPAPGQPPAAPPVPPPPIVLASALPFAGYTTPQAMTPLPSHVAQWLSASLLGSSSIARGELGQSCDDVCHKTHGGKGRCDPTLMHAINRCDVMQTITAGCKCLYSAGRELPMFYSDPGTNSCYVQIFPGRRFDCGARWNQARRLCACTAAPPQK